MSYRKNKVTVGAAWVGAAVLLVACAEAQGDGSGNTIEKFCSNTEYKETCMRSVAKANSTDPHELIKATFNAAVEELLRVIKGTGLYKKLRSGRNTRVALAVCDMTLNRVIDDLRMSLLKFDHIHVGSMEHNIFHVRNWLSATIAHKAVCIDGFDNIPGDTGKQVRQMLQPTDEFLTNSLHLVTQLQKALSSFDNLGLGDFANELKKRQVQLNINIPEHARKLIDGTPTPETLPPKLTVAQDGSGDCTTITEAVARLGGSNSERVVIKVKAGTYKEKIVIEKGLNNLYFIGEGALNTIITGDEYVYDPTKVHTWQTSTFRVEADGFMARDITFENTAPTKQAVALRVTSRQAVFYRCHMRGFQDTLWPTAYLQFYRECRISGTVDFTFGDANAVFQKCEFVARKHPQSGQIMVTAQGREKDESDGVFVLHDCTITADNDFVNAQPPQEAYLGRPWKPYSRTIVLQSDIGSCIRPAGWYIWDGSPQFINTLYYAEFGNRGPSSDLSGRPTNWPGYQKNYTEEEAKRWLPQTNFKDVGWIRQSGVPYDPGFIVIPDTPTPTLGITDEKRSVRKRKRTSPKKHTEDL